ncbi:MAG: hypothetical protein ABI200_00800 [Gaiellales bacterium]
MNPPATMPASSVSNLVPTWDDGSDGGGSYAPRAVAQVATVVEQAVHAVAPRPTPQLIAPPERFDAAEEAVRPSSFTYDLLREDAQTWAEDGSQLPDVDYDALRRRDIARALLRDRLVAIAERRERRSAYEIVFILIASAVAVLLAAPPLVQVLLAANGIQA